jgi:hypothetical protein
LPWQSERRAASQPRAPQCQRRLLGDEWQIQVAPVRLNPKELQQLWFSCLGAADGAVCAEESKVLCRVNHYNVQQNLSSWHFLIAIAVFKDVGRGSWEKMNLSCEPLPAYSTFHHLILYAKTVLLQAMPASPCPGTAQRRSHHLAGSAYRRSRWDRCAAIGIDPRVTAVQPG